MSIDVKADVKMEAGHLVNEIAQYEERTQELNDILAQPHRETLDDKLAWMQRYTAAYDAQQKARQHVFYRLEASPALIEHLKSIAFG